jgi:tetratricopeptide (TPR) repeat protein
VKQFFLRDFPDEPAMLQEIMAMMEKFDFIISFNGKSYDWPLLITRFTYHRMKIRNAEPGHFDLLHAARRIWKNSLPDCSLGSLERHVLRVQRQGDIPSSFIPQMYFDYLRTKNATPLKPVFYHNEMDILSMVTLTILLHDVHEKPLAHLNRPAELLSLANHYDHIEQWEQNVRIYQQVFTSAALPQHKQDSGIRLGYCLKRLERWEEALKLWEGLSALGPFRLEPYEERAKYFEHRARDLEQAEKIVLQALAKLDIVEQLRSDRQLVECRDSLMFRLNRLRRKLASPPE